MKTLKTCLVAIAASTIQIAAHAAVITFDAVPSSGDPILTSLTTDGFNFTGGHFHTIDNPFTGLVNNGSPIYLISEAEGGLGQPITMGRTGGGTFSLNQFDGAETFFGSPTWHFINLSGVQLGGGTLSAQFTLDGIADGAGGVADFQTFALSGWDNLVSVTFSGSLATGGHGGFSIDNMVVDRSSVPEPTSLALLGIALAGLGGSRRRKQRISI